MTMLRKEIEVSVKKINHSPQTNPQCQYSQLGPPYQKLEDSIEDNYTEKLKIPLIISREVGENRPHLNITKKDDTLEKRNLITNIIEVTKELIVPAISNAITGGTLPNLMSIKGFILKVMPSVFYYILPYIIVLALNFFKRKNKPNSINQTKSLGNGCDLFQTTKELKTPSWTKVWCLNAILRLALIFFIFGAPFLHQHGHSPILTFIFNPMIKMVLSIAKTFLTQKMIVNEDKESLIFPRIEEPVDSKKIAIPVLIETDKNNRSIR